MRRVLGIDPGLSGAVAALEDGKIVGIVDMPTVEVGWDKKKRRDVSPALLHDAILDLRDRMGGTDLAVIERQTASPQMGTVSAFSLGNSYGIICGVIACMGISVTHVPPSNWKRQLKLSKDKALSRARAIEIWPDQSAYFARVKDTDRAEAALLAYYGWRNYT